MIITKLRGGLGNQMFQYAYGKKLALENGVPLKLDLSWFSSPGAINPKREYDLGMFAMKPEAVSRLEILWAKIFGTYVAGFWQSESYFKSIEADIRKDFSFAQEVSSDSLALLSTIASSPSVCLNVRRTDFMKHDMFVGILYYEKAVAKMLSLVPHVKFFVFSDDIEWCGANLSFVPDAIFVGTEHAGPMYANYLQLMTACKHFIIPNSTFAWWAAWLCSNPSKVIIAPEHWMLGEGTESHDTVPDTWIRI